MKACKIICKIMVRKNVKTNNWECIVRDRDGIWKIAPTFETKEKAIKYAASNMQYLGVEFEVVEL